MRFQHLENNKIYKLNREEELQKLRERIQQIKTRKNEHLGDGKQKHLLPFISKGYGFSKQKVRQIEKQNQRLQHQLQKVKNAHSTYFLRSLGKISSTQDQKKKKMSSNQLSTHRSVQNLLIPVMRSERAGSNEAQKNIETDQKQHMTSRPNNFRKQIIKIYTQSFEVNKRKNQQKSTHKLAVNNQ